ncbi:MAG: dihydroorotase [Prevotella sp.]|nr:dihydroorotase [Prevotella sp.]
MRTLIKGGRIVNEGRTYDGDIVIEDEKILTVCEYNEFPETSVDKTIDVSGCFVLPGIIDDHVHFREPGMTEKADIESESRAAAAGGVTSYFDMPNTVPQTTTLEALDEKFRLAAEKSHVNYSFFFGATNQNADLLPLLDTHRIPGVKVFMGSSTGNMLVDRDEALERIFSKATMPIMTHCEDTAIINRNMADVKESRKTDDPEIFYHPLIRSEEACLQSTLKAIELAIRCQARLHIAHITTAAELEMIPANCLHTITAEATVGHLMFSMVDYERLGAKIKVNPAIKFARDQVALREGLMDGRISVVGTDHAPHLLSQKEGGAARATSGMPMIQFSLVSMLELVDEGVLTIERMVELMAHHPAQIFEVRNRGYLRPGYQADIVVVRPKKPWTVTKEIIESKCGWSPMEGHTFQWQVEKTFCNGNLIYQEGKVEPSSLGQPILFR